MSNARNRAERIVRDARAAREHARYSFETSGTIDAYERSITRALNRIESHDELDAVTCEIEKIEGTHVVAHCHACSACSAHSEI